MARRKPSRHQALLPLRDTVRPGSDLDREVREFAAESKREPLPGQAELPMDQPEPEPERMVTQTEWAERHLDRSMTLLDDEPWTDEELAWMRAHPEDFPKDYERNI
jgi:hypothetical protein